MELINDLSKYVNLNSFDSIQPEIYRGLAKAKSLAKVGNLDISPNCLTKTNKFKPLCLALEEYNSLDANDPLKVYGKDLSDNKLATYLKYALDGYDLYTTYHRKFFEEYFPSLNAWINSIDVFEEIHDAYIMSMTAGGISFEHRHPKNEKLAEFIYVRPKVYRPFYIIDPNTNTKAYLNTRVAYWNDQLVHGGDPIMQNTYSLRIDGVFNKEIKKKIKS